MNKATLVAIRSANPERYRRYWLRLPVYLGKAETPLEELEEWLE